MEGVAKNINKVDLTSKYIIYRCSPWTLGYWMIYRDGKFKGHL
jgi:hypothetical protein